jgi:hypothetical protein
MPYPECDLWRQRVLKAYVDNPPDLVIVADFATSYALSIPDWYQRKTAFLGSIPDGTHVIVMTDVPWQSADPLRCLSREVDDARACATDRDVAVPALAAEINAKAATDGGATYVDFTDYLCSSVCPVVVGDTLLYRDRNHLTATAAAHFEPLFAQAIASALGA